MSTLLIFQCYFFHPEGECLHASVIVSEELNETDRRKNHNTSYRQITAWCTILGCQQGRERQRDRAKEGGRETEKNGKEKKEIQMCSEISKLQHSLWIIWRILASFGAKAQIYSLGMRTWSKAGCCLGLGFTGQSSCVYIRELAP